MKTIFKTDKIEQIFNYLYSDEGWTLYNYSLNNKKNYWFIRNKNRVVIDKTSEEIISMILDKLDKKLFVFDDIYLAKILDKSILPISIPQQTMNNYCASISKEYVNIMSELDIHCLIHSNITILEKEVKKNKEQYKSILVNMIER